MKKRDFILIGAILVIIAISIAVTALTKKDGSYVIVRVDGKQVAKYSLSENGEYELNGGTNVLRIKDGKAYVEDANCPGGKGDRCTVHAPISYDWESIICAPHEIVIAVQSSK